MNLSQIIKSIKSKGLNFSHYFGEMDSSKVFSYKEVYEHLKEDYLRYLDPPYNFTAMGSFGKTYEDDLVFYKGENIGFIYIILGLAKLCFEYKLPYYDFVKSIFTDFFNSNSLIKISEILPQNEKSDFIKDYHTIKKDFDEKIKIQPKNGISFTKVLNKIFNKV